MKTELSQKTLTHTQSHTLKNRERRKSSHITTHTQFSHDSAISEECWIHFSCHFMPYDNNSVSLASPMKMGKIIQPNIGSHMKYDFLLAALLLYYFCINENIKNTESFQFFYRFARSFGCSSSFSFNSNWYLVRNQKKTKMYVYIKIDHVHTNTHFFNIFGFNAKRNKNRFYSMGCDCSFIPIPLATDWLTDLSSFSLLLLLFVSFFNYGFTVNYSFSMFRLWQCLVLKEQRIGRAKKKCSKYFHSLH